MEWQPEDRDAWVADAEQWISQIKSVLQCKIDLAHDGEVSGVHVVARSDREPRHIVRDVEGLLKARLGISVFYKKIGVVQVVESETPQAQQAVRATADDWQDGLPYQSSPTAESDDIAARRSNAADRAGAAPGERVDHPAGEESSDRSSARALPPDLVAQEAVLLAEELAPRLLCNGVGVMMTGNTLRAEVDLQAAGLEAVGVAEGSNRAGGDLHLVAAATLDAIENLVGEPLGLELSDLRRERLGGGDVVLVAIAMVKGRSCEQLYGACESGANMHQAVVYAVLDALNRRLELMLFRSASDVDD